MSHSPRGTTSASTATAIPRPATGTSRFASDSPTVVPAATSRSAPFTRIMRAQPGRSRSGSAGRRRASGRSPASPAATMSAVTGGEQHAAAVMSGRVVQARHPAEGAEHGTVVGSPRPQPRDELLDLQLDAPRNELGSLAQQLVTPPAR